MCGAGPGCRRRCPGGRIWPSPRRIGAGLRRWAKIRRWQWSKAVQGPAVAPVTADVAPAAGSGPPHNGSVRNGGCELRYGGLPGRRYTWSSPVRQCAEAVGLSTTQRGSCNSGGGGDSARVQQLW
uniref:Uncharacterized protein n=1 Tax=Arundo donax TaxID=35708 RepID=A0A0A8Y4E8_ARUDO